MHARSRRRPVTGASTTVNEQRDERSLPRSSRSVSAGAHAGIAHAVPTDTRRGAAATVDARGAPAQRATCAARASHAVYRGFGGVSTPPNLQPFSRARSAASRSPQAAPGGALARCRCSLTAGGFGVAGLSRFAWAWGRRLQWIVQGCRRGAPPLRRSALTVMRAAESLPTGAVVGTVIRGCGAALRLTPAVERHAHACHTYLVDDSCRRSWCATARAMAHYVWIKVDSSSAFQTSAAWAPNAGATSGRQALSSLRTPLRPWPTSAMPLPAATSPRTAGSLATACAMYELHPAR